MPSISVVMSVLNGSRFLDEALRSLEYQTFKDFELIIIDDGSKDDSIALIRKYQKCLDLELFQNKENLGIKKTLEIGVSRSRTSKIIIFDQDDVCSHRRVEYFNSAFQSGAKLVASSYAIIDSSSRLTGALVEIPPQLQADTLFFELIKRNYFLGSAMGFDANSLNFKNIPDDSGMATDYGIALELSKKECDIRLFSEPLLCYRVHEDNTSRKYEHRDRDAKNVLKNYLSEKRLRKESVCSDAEKMLALMIGYQFVGDFLMSRKILRKIDKSTMLGAAAPEQIKLEYLFYCACQHYYDGNFEEALDLLTGLHNQDYKNPVFLNNMGCVFRCLGMVSKSAEVFKRAIEIAPNYRDARSNIEGIKHSFSDVRFTGRLPRAVLV